MDSALLHLLNSRHASRAIATTPIPEAVIDELVEAVRLSPSCFNHQPWRYIFLTGVEALAMARAALSRGNAVWADRAPLLIVAYSRVSDDCVMGDGREYYQFDLGLSVMNLMLMATERRLTARPMAGFDPKAIGEAFELEEEDEPLVIIAVGYQDDDESYLPEDKQGRGKKPRVRKPAAETVRRL